MLVFDLDKGSEGLFKLHLHAKGTEFTLGSPTDHCIVFVLKGKIQTAKQNSENVIFGTNSMFFSPEHLGPYQSIAEEDSLLIVLKSENILSFIDLVFLNKTISEYAPNVVELEKLHIKKILRNFLFNIIYYKQNEISSQYLQDVKRKEFIYLLRVLYSKKSLARFFSPLSISQQPFKFSVYTNYTDDCTAKILAEKCFMTTKTFTRKFKTEFGTTPHKWITEQKIKRLEYSLSNEIQSHQEVLDKFHFSNMADLSRFCQKHGLKIDFASPKLESS